MRRAMGPRTGRASGFTLIELMVVVSILGIVLLMVPASMEGFGARARLESKTNTLASVETAAREQAIIDSHEVILEIHLYDAPSGDKGKWSGWRYILANRTHEAPSTLDPSQAAAKESRPVEEDEWVEMPWDMMPEGVRLTGFSVSREQWVKSPGGTLRVSFGPDGSVRPAHALRVESIELPRGASVMTVRVNALTALAEVIEGEAELTSKRDPSDFR